VVRVFDASTGSSHARLFWTGERYFAMLPWAVNPFRPLDAQGVPRDATSFVLPAEALGGTLDAAWSGSGFGATFSDAGQSLFFITLDGQGEPSGEPLWVWDGASGRVAWSGSRYGMFWGLTDALDDHYIYSALFDADGGLVGGDIVLGPPAVPGQPHVAWDGEHYGLAFLDHRSTAPEVYFALVDPGGARVGSESPIFPTDEGGWTPNTFVWTGTEYALFWEQQVPGNPIRRILMARVDAAGQSLGPPLEVLAGLGSGHAAVAWSGAEYGLLWAIRRDEQTPDAMYFIRLDPGGTPIGDPVRFTPETDVARPSIVWNGEGYAVTWFGHPDFWFGRIGCECPRFDDDADGFPFGPCAGRTGLHDCDDSDESIHPGGEQTCDGLNNDCNHLAWPELNDTNEWDDDGDLLAECEGDCDDTDGAVWEIPGEARNLALTFDRVTFSVHVRWDPPESGAGAVVYDVLRARVPWEFSTQTTCIESDDGTDTQAVDTTYWQNSAFYYLVRAQNTCGAGSIGTAPDGAPRVGRTCGS
jgi:hypothetical protein